MSNPNPSRSLSQWLGYIESIHPSEIELGLSRVATVADRLGLLSAIDKKTVITVAGTNGKGSCVASLEALLATHPAQPTFGAYTSPHFIHYNERIRVNAESAIDADICRAFDAIETARAEISLSYFEFATLAALHVFVQADCDYIILEVGLGGRLDAVNIVDANVAVVTSIALDHQDWLGSNLEQIGREKAGIIKPGKIAISASEAMPSSVAEVANELSAEHWQAQQDFHYQVLPGSEQDQGECSNHTQLRQQLRMSLDKRQLQISLPSLPIPSVVAACLALELLGVLADDECVEKTLTQLQLTGRCQKLQWHGRELLLDVAHNPAASQHLQERLDSEEIGVSRLADNRQFLLLGAMADKDLAGIVKPWQGRIDMAFACDLPNTPRAATAKLLYSTLEQYHIKSLACENVAIALESCLQHSKEGDRIIVMGSFFTVAAALSHLQVA